MRLTIYRQATVAAVFAIVAGSAATSAAATNPLRPSPFLRPVAGQGFGLGSLPPSVPESILYAFQGAPDAQYPSGSMAVDAAGSLYGTSQNGGASGPSSINGTVFKMTRVGSGYTESVIYSFGTSGPNDGYFPWFGGVVVDRAGNVFGTTNEGGGSTNCGQTGCGTVFELTPNGSGYSETILHSFQGSDGEGPDVPPTLGRNGVLYGTTVLGGSGGWGVVYKLTPTKHGYTYSVLHNFPSGSSDGNTVYAGLLVDDRTGDLYGATAGGPGSSLNGMVFKLHPTPSGYVESILYAFQGAPDGSEPNANPIMNKAGVLYGTTGLGGTSSACGGGCGTVYELIPTQSGSYTEKVIYGFAGGPDGAYPDYPLAAGPRGSLYSTAYNGGTYGWGTAFGLSRTKTGYREATLHQFNPNVDGALPNDVLLEGDDLIGELYGAFSGPNVNGSVFALHLR